MSLAEYIKTRDTIDARNGLTQAYLSEETPEQAVARTRRAREFNLPVGLVDGISPEEVAKRKAEAVDWAAMQVEAPQLTRRLADTNFANMVKDDVTNVGLLERSVWMLAPDGGRKPEGLWETARNSGARGAYGLAMNMPGLGSVEKATEHAKAYHDILDKEKAIAEGADIATVFGTPEDPTGQEAYAKFQLTKDNDKTLLQQLVKQETDSMAWAKEMQDYFPASEVMQKLNEAKTLGEALSIAIENPLETIANVAPESFTQMAPAVLGMSLGGPVSWATTFANSAGLDRNASLVEGLTELGIDLRNSEAIAQALLDPTKREAIGQKIKEANAHALPTAMADTLSLGLAKVNLLPKSLRSMMSKGKANLAETALQLPLQGALGAGGEALGQLNAKGEITSYGDIVAEFLGEFSTAPVEVFSASIGATNWAERRAQKAAEDAQKLQAVTEALQKTQLAQRDPDTAEQMVNSIAQEAGISKVYVNPYSLQQAGKLDEVRAVSPTVDAQADKALETGEDIEVPMGEYATKIAPNDDGTVGSIVSIGDGVSVQEALEQQEEVKQAVDQAVKEAREAESNEFRVSRSFVSDSIKKQLSGIEGLTNDEKRAVRTTVLAAVASLAKDMGALPEQVWQRYGAMFLDSGSIHRDEQGNVRIGRMEQAGEEGSPRGEYFPGLNIIARWRTANRSTLLHETGHLFLEMRLRAMRDLLLLEGPLTRSQQRVVDIGVAILDWAGIKLGDIKNAQNLMQALDAWDALPQEKRTEIHEKWARTYEAYVMEGVAPTRALQKAFNAFTTMLKQIYHSIAGIDHALDDTVRELYDALFISSNQLNTYKLQHQANSMFYEGDLEMTPEVREEYEEAHQQMLDEAEAEQYSRAGRLGLQMRNIKRKIESAVKRGSAEVIKRVRAEVTTEVMKTRTGRTWKVLREGITKAVIGDTEHTVKPKIFWGDMKLLGYSQEQLAILQKNRLATKRKDRRGMELGVLATALGYADGKELIDDMLANADLNAVIDERVKAALLKDFPSIANEQAQARTAAAMWYNEGKMLVLHHEINALERMGNAQTRTLVPVFERLARAIIAKTPLDKVAPHIHAREARKAARRSFDAFRKGNIQDAIKFKRQEIYQSALAKAAKEALENRDKLDKLIKPFMKKEPPKNITPGHAEVIQRVLAALGIVDLKRVGLNPTDKTLKDLLVELEKEHDVSVDVDPVLLGRLDSDPCSAVQTAGDLALLLDFFEQLKFVGRLAQTVIINGKRQDLLETAEGINDAVRHNAVERGRSDADLGESKGKSGMIADALKTIGLSHARIPSLLAAIEGTRFGTIFDAIVAPLDKAASKAEVLKNHYAKKLNAIFSPVMRELASTKRKHYKSVDMELTRMEVFAIVLNCGNEGNLNRLLQTIIRPGKPPLTPPQIHALINEALSPQDLQIIQAVWDLFEGMRSEVGAVAKRMVGREPLWVDAVPMRVLASNGEYVDLRGGYYPIVYNPNASPKAGRIQEVKDAKSMSSIHKGTEVFDGHTKTRQDKVDPDLMLSLTLRGAFEGLDRQIHYVAYAEWVNNTNRLLRKIDPKIRHFWGREPMDAIYKWVEDIRTGGRGQKDQADAIADFFRKNISLAGIGFNLVTALVQPVGLIQSIPVIGAKWMARGLRDFIANPFKARDYVASMSPMMLNRMQTQFRELAEIQAQLNGTTSPLKEKFMRSAYYPVVVAQMLVDIPTWIGAYNKALNDGMSDERAIAVADRSVIDAQGSGRLHDLSGVERGGPWKKLFTVFYTFFNTALNVAVVSGYTKKKMEAAVDLMMLLLLQPIAEAILRSLVDSVKEGEDLDSDWWDKTMEKAGTNCIGFSLGLLVGLRENQYLSEEDSFGYSGPGGLRKIEDLGRMINSWKDGEIDMATVKATVNFMGSFGGLPAVAINRAITGATALAEDKTDNPLVLVLGYSDK